MPTETYLRPDVSCGLDSCTQCTFPGILDSSFPILMPDSEALSAFHEVFQLSEVTNVLILSSVLNQAKLSKAREAKIRSMMRDRRRRCFMFDDQHHILTHPKSALVPHQEAAQYLPPYCSPSILEGLGPQAACLRQMLSSAAFLTMHWRSIDDDKEPPPLVVLTSLAQPPADDEEEKEEEEEGDDTDVQALLSLLELNDSSQVQSQRAPNSIEWPPTRGTIHVTSPEILFSPHCWGKDHPESTAVRLTESILFSSRGGNQSSSQDALEGPAHWSQPQVLAGLSLGTLFKGRLDVSRRSRREGVVIVSASSPSALDDGEEPTDGTNEDQGGIGARNGDRDQVGRMLRVSGLAAMNRAMHGDIVVVKLIPRMLELDNDPEEDPTENEGGEETLIDLSGGGVEGGGEGEGEGGGGRSPIDLQGSSLLPLAQVVAVISREQVDVVACLRREDEYILLLSSQSSGVRSELVVALPLDPRLPLVRLRTRQAHQLVNQRFVLRIDSWERGSRWPSGHLVKVLGPLGDLQAESEAVLIKCGINHLPFCQGALDELPKVASPSEWHIEEEERRARRDLTDCLVCSIDPPGCTDVDDAMHMRRLPNGQVEVGVHIADVSFFVKEGGLLDAEAMDRCTSVYLVDRRIDMLPSLLSEHLCSLRSGVERLSVSVVWTLSQDMKVLNVWMGRSIIRSRYQLTYQEAQDIFEGRPPEYIPSSDASSLADSISYLFILTRMLRGKRREAGALLDLAGGELKFELDPETGRPVEVAKKEKLESMDVVAEMMIWANGAVAERIVQYYPGSALLRNHPAPTKSFDNVAPFLSGSDGKPIDTSSNKRVALALEQTIQRMRTQDNRAAESLVCSLVTQCMNEAQYLSSGSISSGSQKHYGLALDFYTHFTSPIRRYADIIVHRQLLRLCSTRHQELALMAHRMNERHRQAKEASKVCNELFLLELFVTRPHVVEAIAVKVLADRSLIEVFIPSYSMKGVVKLTDASGLIIPPLGHENQEALFIVASAPTGMVDSPRSIEMVTEGKDVVWSAREGAIVFVELSAHVSRAHGPRLQIRVSLNHPQLKSLAIDHQPSPFVSLPPSKAAAVSNVQTDDVDVSQDDGEEAGVWKSACLPAPLVSNPGREREARLLKQVEARVMAKIDRTAPGSKRWSELMAIKSKMVHLQALTVDYT